MWQKEDLKNYRSLSIFSIFDRILEIITDLIAKAMERVHHATLFTVPSDFSLGGFDSFVNYFL